MSAFFHTKLTDPLHRKVEMLNPHRYQILFCNLSFSSRLNLPDQKLYLALEIVTKCTNAFWVVSLFQLSTNENCQSLDVTHVSLLNNLGRIHTRYNNYTRIYRPTSLCRPIRVGYYHIVCVNALG